MDKRKQHQSTYLQLGCPSILVTLQLQLTAFIPGASVGKLALMLSFMDVAPEYASIKGVSSVKLPTGSCPSTAAPSLKTFRLST